MAISKRNTAASHVSGTTLTIACAALRAQLHTQRVTQR